MVDETRPDVGSKEGAKSVEWFNPGLGLAEYPLEGKGDQGVRTSPLALMVPREENEGRCL